MKAKAKEHYDTGVDLIERGLNNKSMIAFKEALVIDRAAVLEELRDLYTHFLGANNLESALSVGHLLLGEERNNAELANNLGNYSRNLGYIEDAQNCYKKSLEIDPNYAYPAFNLAALSVQAPYMDQDAVAAGTFLGPEVKFIIPDFLSLASQGKELYEDADFFPVLRSEQEKEAAEEKRQELERLEQKKLEITQKMEDIRGEILKGDKKEEQEEKEPSQDMPDAEKNEDDFDYEVKSKQTELSEQLSEINDSIAEKSKQAIDVNRKINQYFETLLQEAVKNNNTQFRDLILYNRARFNLEIGNYADCLRQLRHISMKKRFKFYKLMYTVAWGMHNSYKEAIEYLLSFLAKDQYDRYVLVNIGLFYRHMNKRHLSLKYLIMTKLLLEYSEGIYGRDEFIQLAHSRFYSGELDKACKNYEILFREKTISYEINYNYAKTLFEFKHQLAFPIKLLKPLVKTPNSFSKAAQYLLYQIEEELLMRAREAYADSKYEQSVEYYMAAFGIEKRLTTGKKLLKIFGLMEGLTAEQKRRKNMVQSAIETLEQQENDI